MVKEHAEDETEIRYSNNKKIKNQINTAASVRENARTRDLKRSPF